jgi:hypothetical protein
MTRVPVVKITNEFILGPDVLWVHDASVDLGHCGSFPYMKRNNKVVAAVCGRVVAVQLEGPLAAMNILTGTGSRPLTELEYVG